MSEIAATRARFAAAIAQQGNLRSPALVQALATVAREDFLPPGPWAVWEMLSWQYATTPDADARRVYCDAPIAIDRERLLNNGQPSFVAMLIDALDLHGGEHVVHVGCGTGYYTAVLAQTVGAAGHVIAIEYDADLAARARANLADVPQVSVIHGDGCTHDSGMADAMLINAGATHPRALWLDRLRSGGRLIVPLVRWPSDASESGVRGGGVVLKVTRGEIGYAARIVSSAMIFPCIGAVDTDADQRLAAAFARMTEADAIRSLRRDVHEADASCWLHGDGFCLSIRPPNT
ncbi:MAG: methyltransferase domain-containing protein [Deltaproteobacteria bacterium]|nr:methyltransferase domain-containing protein [Deltaproteobacteria bacterium]MBI3390128.1 methyltransferase domain-containing protein [Deltaproteobacteria bacterium]